jgi:hypothetical protein
MGSNFMQMFSRENAQKNQWIIKHQLKLQFINKNSGPLYGKLMWY